MKILVTAGATREPLDEVRFFSNVSTGATGAALADALAARGHEVTVLRGAGAVEPRAVRDVTLFSSADDLRVRLRERLAGGAFDVVVMCAAVADYRPAQRQSGKIGSDAERLTIELVRNEKILPQLKSFSPRPLRVIGFKLTAGAEAAARQAAVAAQFATGAVDAVVHNDLTEMAGAAAHPFWWYGGRAEAARKVVGEAALAELLDTTYPATGDAVPVSRGGGACPS